MSENEKIAAIGPRQQMLTLKSVGVRTYELEASDFNEAEDLLNKLASDGAHSLILITEAVAETIGAESVAAAREKSGTVIMAVPSHEGSTGLTEKWFKRAMEHSIGVDLISD